MMYKEEAPRRIAVLQKGLEGNGHCDNSNIHPYGVNTPVKPQGKIIGVLSKHTFIKRVKASKHMLRKPPAWCISKQAFCEEVLPNTENIIIEDIESGIVYECLTKVFAEHAFEIQRGNSEPQLALGLRFWQIKNSGYHQLNLWGCNSNT